MRKYFWLFFVAMAPYCMAQKTILPQFPGGKEQLDNYLQQQTASLYQGNYASSMIFFYVGTDGSIRRATIATGYYDEPDFPGDSLALEIVKRMPAWVPGSVDGVPQEMAASVTVLFDEARSKWHGDPIPDSNVEFMVVDIPEEAKETTKIDTPKITRKDVSEDTEECLDWAIVEYSDFEEDALVISIADEKPFSAVEEMPTFPGGEAEWQKYLAANLKYPTIAQENEIEGTVTVNFVVEKDGSLSNIHVAHGLYPPCDEEAIRLIKVSPKWIPGKQNKANVRVNYTAKIVFEL